MLSDNQKRLIVKLLAMLRLYDLAYKINPDETLEQIRIRMEKLYNTAKDLCETQKRRNSDENSNTNN